jgi:serine/threonine protein kinase/tetratricopeptide (TPR) repeat protein
MHKPGWPVQLEMKSKEAQQIEELFHAAMDLRPDERSAYLAEACSGNPELQEEVASLIAAADDGNGFIDQPAFHLALRVMGSQSSESMLGKTIGPYKIESALGKGGMGEVYLATDAKLGRKVALKFLSPEFIGDTWAKRQLIKEAQAVAMLDHQNICPVYGIEENDGHSFIVMQHVEGETLCDLIRARRPEPSEVLALAKQIVSALADAHAHGIIHRDIKPKNIMVTPGGQVKVLDFGLAKLIQQKKSHDGEDSVSHLSQKGIVPGTVAYMSPEQLRGERLDYRSDIFSLGTVLYELFSGANPFGRPSSAETISAVLTLEPPSLRDNQPELSKELDSITQKCLCKDREERYQAATALHLDLENVPSAKGNRANPREYLPLRVIAAVIALLVFVGVLSQIWPARPPEQSSLVVLPIENETGDPSLEYLTDGLADSLTIQLSRVSRLTIYTPRMVARYKGPAAEPKSLGRSLNVKALLIGTLVKHGEKLGLHVRLVSTKDGNQMWDGSYDLGSNGLGVLRADIASNVIPRLLPSMSPDEARMVEVGGTPSYSALMEYFRGRYYWQHRNKENIQKALERFTKAIQLDPAFAQAYAGLSDCYVLMNTTAYGDMSTDEAMNRARATANQALQIDSTLPEAHVSMGMINLKYDWDWPKAEKEFKDAMLLYRDYPPAHYGYSMLLAITGRQTEAFAEAELARKFDPISPSTMMNSCRLSYFARQYDKAAKCLEEMLVEIPDNVGARHVLGYVYLKQGRNKEAIDAFQALPETQRTLKMVSLGYAYAQTGQRKKAEDILAEVERMYGSNDIPPLEVAVLHLGLGNKDQAFAWINKACDEKFAPLIYLNIDPAFDSLKSDPRFKELARRINLN